MMNKKGMYDLAWDVVMLAVKDVKGVGYLSAKSGTVRKRAMYFLMNYENSFWYNIIPLTQDDIKTLLSFKYKKNGKIDPTPF